MNQGETAVVKAAIDTLDNLIAKDTEILCKPAKGRGNASDVRAHALTQAMERRDAIFQVARSLRQLATSNDTRSALRAPVKPAEDDIPY